jgi:hypothetical protein
VGSCQFAIRYIIRKPFRYLKGFLIYKENSKMHLHIFTANRQLPTVNCL